MSTTQKLFTEKFRPKSLEHMILLPRIQAHVKDGRLHQNLLLTGNPGTGKTTLAKILAAGYDYLYINVSNESSVETVRTQIIDFCSTVSLLNTSGDRMKVVLLDEMDGASEQFYKALRATIEQFSATTRFVGTCNYINKVPDHIQSRFEVISFDPVNREEEEWLYNIQVKRLKVLVGKLEIEMPDEAMKEFVRRNFPDMRKMYNRIQGWHIKGIKNIDVSDIKSLNWSFVELFQMIVSQPDPINNYKEVLSNYSDKIDDVLQSLGTEFIEWLRENHSSKVKKVPEIIILVAKYQAQRTQVIDQAVNLLALIFEIQQSLNKAS